MDEADILQQQIELYRRAFLEHGDSPESTFNTRAEYQQLRFERLMRPLLALRPAAFSIHDVGAGICDLHRYLLEQGTEHRYSATEVVSEMVRLGHRKYPGIEIYEGDILCNDVRNYHDFVVCSGMFNMPGETERASWQRFVFDVIRHMYDMCKLAVSFNFLTSYRTFTDPRLHYMDPADVFGMCQRDLSRFATLDHAYPFYECTVAVFRPAAIEAGYDAGIFGKYWARRS